MIASPALENGWLPESEESWLRKLARNIVANHYRHLAPRRRADKIYLASCWTHTKSTSLAEATLERTQGVDGTSYCLAASLRTGCD